MQDAIQSGQVPSTGGESNQKAVPCKAKRPVPEGPAARLCIGVEPESEFHDTGVVFFVHWADNLALRLVVIAFALNTGIRVDDIDVVAFGNRADGALRFTGATADAFLVDTQSHAWPPKRSVVNAEGLSRRRQKGREPTEEVSMCLASKTTCRARNFIKMLCLWFYQKVQPTKCRSQLILDSIELMLERSSAFTWTQIDSRKIDDLLIQDMVTKRPG